MFKRFLPAVLALSALPAWGATTFYYTGHASNHEAAFDAALLSSGLTLSSIIDFGGSAGFSGSSLTVSGTTFAATGLSVPGAGSTLNVQAGADLTVTPGDTYAIGIHLATIGAQTMACFVDCGNVLTINGSAPPEFVGIISDTPLSSFLVDIFGGQLQVVNFQIGTMNAGPPPSETPEPSSMALMGGALIALPLLARRKRRR